MKRFEGRKGPPKYVIGIANWTWKKKISPFTYGRALCRCISYKGVNKYVSKR
jgi:hypothetical protein